MDMWTLYWLTRIEGLGAFFEACAAIAGTGLVLWAFFWITEFGMEEAFRPKAWLAGAFVFFLLLSVLTPSNKDLAIIFGGHYAINNEEMQKMPTKAAKVVNRFMDEYLAEPKSE